MTKPKPKPTATRLWHLLAQLEDTREAVVEAMAAENWQLVISHLTLMRGEANDARDIATMLRRQEERNGGSPF